MHCEIQLQLPQALAVQFAAFAVLHQKVVVAVFTQNLVSQVFDLCLFFGKGEFHSADSLYAVEVGVIEMDIVEIGGLIGQYEYGIICGIRSINNIEEITVPAVWTDGIHEIGGGNIDEGIIKTGSIRIDPNAMCELATQTGTRRFPHSDAFGTIDR